MLPNWGIFTLKNVHNLLIVLIYNYLWLTYFQVKALQRLAPPLTTRQSQAQSQVPGLNPYQLLLLQECVKNSFLIELERAGGGLF